MGSKNIREMQLSEICPGVILSKPFTNIERNKIDSRLNKAI